MSSLRSCAFLAALAAPAALLAQNSSSAPKATAEGTVSVSAGGAILSGDTGAYQQHFQQRMDGFGGIEELRYKSETKTWSFKLDGRLVPGNADYLLHLRYDRSNAWYVDAGYTSQRFFYDGSGGYFFPSKNSFHLYDEAPHLDRSLAWIELGWAPEEKPYFKLRYEHATRDGVKGSTSWADTNIVPTAYGTKNIVPTFLDLDETRDTVMFDAGHETDEQQWQVGLRYDRTSLDNQRNSHRRPFEASADRYVTNKDETKTSMFNAHGFGERKLGEKLLVSAGASITTLDTNLEGSRIFGSGYDPIYDPAYARRQARDEGFYDLEGGSTMKQYVLNANLVYIPAKNWTVTPSLRFEDMRTDNVASFIETAVQTNLSMLADEMESQSSKSWDEFTEALEVHYTGLANWTFTGRTEWIQGKGDLDEDLLDVEAKTATIDRVTNYTRDVQKYSFTSNWYAKPGLSFAGQYYYKVRLNDYRAVRDSTPAGSADRYPAYIVDQDIETNDFNLRMSWRPASLLSFVTRYDYQQSKIIGTEAGLSEVTSATITSHIVSQNVTWNPRASLYLTANVNVVWDTVATPAKAYILNGDNNYVNGSLGAGYALGKITDVYADYSYYRANNFADNSINSLPYGADEKRHVASITWVRRQTDHLIYTVKYTYATNRDLTSGYRNNYDAHILYGKVEYKF